MNMPDLVFINPKGKDLEPYTTSELLAECTGINHRRIRDAIRKYESDLKTFGKVVAYQTTLQSGQHVPGYRLNEPQSTFLLTLFKNTPVVLAFKKELVRQFYEMRDYIQQLNSPVWQDTRSLGKEIRRRETDAIKRLVDYATEQGSTGAVHYYKALSSLADKAAGIESRDRATIEQLTALYMMEKLIEKEISQGIQSETPYKLIYSACKERLGSFLAVVR